MLRPRSGSCYGKDGNMSKNYKSVRHEYQLAAKRHAATTIIYA